MKNPKHPALRVFGQRSIAPSFLNSRANQPGDSGDTQSKKVEKRVSLSDFLDRKLSKSVLDKPNKEEKRRPFTACASSKDPIQPSDGCEIRKRLREEYKSGNVLEKKMFLQFKEKQVSEAEEEGRNVLDKSSLKLLKPTSVDKMDHRAPCSIDVDEDTLVNEENVTRKRKDPFEGIHVNDRIRKPVLILGDNPGASNPIGKRRKQICSGSKRERPAYNHYANGSGWWDCDMEGVDSEEVGYGEVWEGVGSTTFGDIVDWH